MTMIDYSVKHQLIRHLMKLHDAVFEDERPTPDSGLDNDDYVFVVRLINDEFVTRRCEECSSSHRAMLQIDVWERGGCCDAGVLEMWDMAIQLHMKDFVGHIGRFYITSAYRQSARHKPTHEIKDNALAITVIVEYRR